MSRSIFGSLTFYLAFAIALLTHAPTALSAGRSIQIGVVMSTTGPGAATGIPDRDGLLLALKTINTAGGVNGRPIELFLRMTPLRQMWPLARPTR